jgi:PAS domain S-box-containing protein
MDQEELRQSEKKYHDLYESSRDGYALVDPSGKIKEFNSAFKNMLGYDERELVRKTINDITASKWHGEEQRIFEEQVFKRGYSKLYEKEYQRKDGTVFPIELRTYLVRDNEGNPAGMWAWIRDITERKKIERELKMKSQSLEELNAALRVILKERDGDKKRNEDNILRNVKELVLPYVEKLEESGLTIRQNAYLRIMKQNLLALVSPFLTNLSSKFLNLTPTETKVANLIKEGRTSKDIADLMCLSVRTIEKHRAGIREKVGIRNRKANLRSLLMSLE